jgi:hypothetical protein
MGGLDELFKQIGNIDSTIKLIAFLASILLVTVTAILQYSARISKRVANILIFLFSAIFLIACLAMILPTLAKRTDNLTLTVTLIDNAENPYTSDQADCMVNSKEASVDYSPLAKSWTIVFDPGELPKDRGIFLSAQTKDHKFHADTLIRLTSDRFQTLVLPLAKVPQPIDPVFSTSTFSINLPDETIRQAIAKLTGLTYDPSSPRNKIIVTYESSSIRSIHGTGPYSFVSSCPVILIDGKSHTLDNCYIPEMEPNYTYEIETIRRYAQTKSIEVATAYFRNKPNILAGWIKPQ